MPHVTQTKQAKIVAGDLLASTLHLMKAPPVNLGTICNWLGIEVYAMPCDAFGAMFSLREGKKFLMANDKLPQGRFRFSIAHELGHILLDHEPLKHIYEQRKPAVRAPSRLFRSRIAVAGAAFTL